MKPFPNPIVVNLLTLAGELARHDGGRNLRQAALRRAVSSAYYAVFHALCYVCADGLVRWSRADLAVQVYRALDHASAKRRLSDPLIGSIHPSAPKLQIAFVELQQSRHLADYGPPGQRFTAVQAAALISQARQTMELIQQFDADARTRLAVLLLIGKRAV